MWTTHWINWMLKLAKKNLQLVLVVTGTGLDQVTSNINSNTDIQNIRMKPCGEHVVDSYVRGNFIDRHDDS